MSDDEKKKKKRKHKVGHIPPFESAGDAEATSNAQIYGAAGAHAALQAAQQYAAHNNRMNVMSETVIASLANRLCTPDPTEAVMTQKIMSGNDKIDMGTAMALAQALIK